MKLMMAFGQLGVVGERWSLAKRAHLMVVTVDSCPVVAELDCGDGHGVVFDYG